MPDIKQARILIMATDGFEQSELMVPQEKLSDAGATVEVAAPKSRMKSGNVWYVIVLNKDNPDGGDMRRSPVNAQPVEDRPSASAMVMASIEGKCITVADYKAVPLTSLGEELRRILGDRSLGPPIADSTPPP